MARTELPPELRLDDCSTRSVDASFLLCGAKPRNPAVQTARLAEQFVEQNSTQLRLLDAHISPRYNGTSVTLQLSTSTRVGAVPLRSPVTGEIDYGLTVRPRF